MLNQLQPKTAIKICKTKMTIIIQAVDSLKTIRFSVVNQVKQYKKENLRHIFTAFQ